MKSRPPRQIKAYGLDSVLDFGKWRNSKVRDVIRLDPDYILWAAESVAWFDLCDEAYELAEHWSQENDPWASLRNDYVDFDGN